MNLNRILIGCFFSLIQLSSVCQSIDNFPPPDTPLTIDVHQSNGPITIDGRLDEADWQQASSHFRFL